MQFPPEALTTSRKSTVLNDIARLRGARFASAMELEGGAKLAESLVKQMTGGDRLAARFLYKEYFEFVPEFKIFLATNHTPRIAGTDHAIWRRIRLIPFDVTIPKSKQDTIAKATEAYRNEQDHVSRFVANRSTVRPGGMISKEGLFLAYKKWCSSAGLEALSKPLLGKRLSGLGLTEKKTSKAWFWVGIGIKE